LACLNVGKPINFGTFGLKARKVAHIIKCYSKLAKVLVKKIGVPTFGMPTFSHPAKQVHILMMDLRTKVRQISFITITKLELVIQGYGRFLTMCLSTYFIKRKAIRPLNLNKQSLTSTNDKNSKNNRGGD
jgi:hypothetical protein